VAHLPDALPGLMREMSLSALDVARMTSDAARQL
jgi:hypothetical protein